MLSNPLKNTAKSLPTYFLTLTKVTNINDFYSEKGHNQWKNQQVREKPLFSTWRWTESPGICPLPVSTRARRDWQHLDNKTIRKSCPPNQPGTDT